MSHHAWRCTKCKRTRLVADGLPPLVASLTEKYKRGKCKGCRAMRLFEAERSPEVWQPPALASGERLKEEGMATATRSEDGVSDWSRRADAAIKALALSRMEFTSEDVTARVGLPNRSSGAVGARMNAAAKRGVIVWTGRISNAKRANQHAAALKVWRGA